MAFKYKENRDWIENLGLVTQLGLTMVGCIFFCFFVGWYLDGWLGTGAIFTIVFLLAGIAGGGFTVYRQITEVFEDEKGKRDGPKNGNPQGN